MANEQIKISELTEVTSVTGNEEMPVVQSGSTKKMSLNQAKDFIGGNVIILPKEILDLTGSSSSEEILAAFGGKQSLIDIIKEIKSTEDCIVVASDNNINSASKIVYSTVSVVYTDDNNMALSLIAWTVNITAQMVIKIVNGVASCALNTTPLMTEAPSDGNAYGRKNKGWVEVLEKSKTVEYKYDLREADLDTFKGSGGDIAFIGIQKNNKFATPENHYPIVEAGILIVAGTITKKTNQIYHTYNSNRIFIRSATSSGENGNFSDWVELAKVTDVLTKTNTSSFTPTQPYHPATKAYVDDIGYGRTITTTADKFLNTANLSGIDAEQRVNDLFGSLDNFKNVVANILANHVRYYFHFGDNPNNDCVELGCVNAWRANNNSSHKLNFIITYYDENNLYTNRISIVVNNDTAASKVIIASLVNSDNVATLTKKTSTEYSNINPKANNTAYLVTDD